MLKNALLWVGRQFDAPPPEIQKSDQEPQSQASALEEALSRPDDPLAERREQARKTLGKKAAAVRGSKFKPRADTVLTDFVTRRKMQQQKPKK